MRKIIKDKRGIAVLAIFENVFYFLLISIFLGVIVFAFNLVDTSLDQDIELGQVNLGEVNAQTFGQLAGGLSTHADTIGITLILSMVVLMFLTAYFTGDSRPKLMLVVEILILVFAFVLSVYISIVYNEVIQANALISDTYVNYLPKTSKFMLGLPAYVSTIGIIIIILSYANLGSRKQGDGSNVQGY